MLYNICGWRLVQGRHEYKIKKLIIKQINLPPTIVQHLYKEGKGYEKVGTWDMFIKFSRNMIPQNIHYTTYISTHLRLELLTLCRRWCTTRIVMVTSVTWCTRSSLVGIGHRRWWLVMRCGWSTTAGGWRTLRSCSWSVTVLVAPYSFTGSICGHRWCNRNECCCPTTERWLERRWTRWR